MIVFTKLTRIFLRIYNAFANFVRIKYLMLLYPGLKIIGKTYIAKNCHVVCVDGGKMILKDTYINTGAYVHCSESAVLKIDNSYIGMNTVIAAAKCIEIKAYCEIAEMVVIRDQNHSHNLNSTPIRSLESISAPIIVNQNVWIGSKATILKGVTVGENSVIAASAVVTKDVKECTIVKGIPAH